MAGVVPRSHRVLGDPGAGGAARRGAIYSGSGFPFVSGQNQMTRSPRT
jgi:hypothetical protein